MSNRVAYLNGQFVAEADLKIHAFDLSVMQAAAAFEMTRSFNGVHFKLREHLQRLEQSCTLLSMPFPVTLTDLEDLCYAVSERNAHGPGEEHRLLIVVSPGCAGIYKDLDGVIPHPYVYIADFPLRYTVQGFGRYFTEGVHCSTSLIRQLPDECVTPYAKHRNRLHFHLAQMLAPEKTWPLLREMVDDAYTEAPGANLMTVSGGRVWTHDVDALPGISMQTVAQMTEAQGHYLRDLMGCDEVWLTGTPFCMLPVVSLDGRPIGDGTPGPVYRETLNKWSALVGVDIQRQIEGWDAQWAGANQSRTDLAVR